MEVIDIFSLPGETQQVVSREGLQHLISKPLLDRSMFSERAR